MRKITFFFLAAFLIVFSFGEKTVKADVGPKPSVNVKLEGLKYNGNYYITLLAEEESTGPYSVKNRRSEPYEEVAQKFADLKDKDNYNFLGHLQELDGDDYFSWSYYPPRKYKIALYFPKKDLFLISEKHKAYAFDSYYKMTFRDIDLDMDKEVYYFSNEEIKVEKNYNYTKEVLSFLARAVLTILIEYFLAFIMFRPNSYQSRLIIKTNLLTQGLLNLGLNLILYYQGFLAFFLVFIPLEILVFVIEAYIYKRKLNQKLEASQKKAPAVVYALFANIISGVAGFYLAYFFTFMEIIL